VGLAINGGIVVLSALKADENAMSGDVEATREVVINATRHILGTTFTTVVRRKSVRLRVRTPAVERVSTALGSGIESPA